MIAKRLDTAGWMRRAQPLLGTLVEVAAPHRADAAAAVAAAFTAIREAQARLSRFEPHSDLSRFHALQCGEWIDLHPITHTVLAAAQQLQQASDRLFDISGGAAPDGWALDGHRLLKLDPHIRLDLGGIGKGHAVDLAVAALQQAGCAAGWVNAGGDLRCFGAVELPIQLRDEATGGVQLFAHLQDGAFATSALGPGRRSQLTGAAGQNCHVSVAAPACLWADALTKVVAASGRADHPLLAHHGARAWMH